MRRRQLLRCEACLLPCDCACHQAGCNITTHLPHVLLAKTCYSLAFDVDDLSARAETARKASEVRWPAVRATRMQRALRRRAEQTQ